VGQNELIYPPEFWTRARELLDTHPWRCTSCQRVHDTSAQIHVRLVYLGTFASVRNPDLLAMRCAECYTSLGETREPVRGPKGGLTWRALPKDSSRNG